MSHIIKKWNFFNHNTRALHNTSIVIASDTRRKRLCCASEAISQHVDNPQDCHACLCVSIRRQVVSLLAMTKIDQKEAFAKVSIQEG